MQLPAAVIGGTLYLRYNPNLEGWPMQCTTFRTWKQVGYWLGSNEEYRQTETCLQGAVWLLRVV